jgi:hypothetical protein
VKVPFTVQKTWNGVRDPRRELHRRRRRNHLRAKGATHYNRFLATFAWIYVRNMAIALVGIAKTRNVGPEGSRYAKIVPARVCPAQNAPCYGFAKNVGILATKTCSGNARGASRAIVTNAAGVRWMLVSNAGRLVFVGIVLIMAKAAYACHSD